MKKTLPDSGDIGLVERRSRKGPHIIPSHASTCTALDEGTEDRGRGVIGKIVGHGGSAHASAETTSDVHNLITGASVVSFGWWSSRRGAIAGQDLTK
jgi:hypothetical protein